MRYVLTFHYSDVAKMSAGDVARYIDAESPQEAVNFLVRDEERNGYSVTNIKVYEVESLDDKLEGKRMRGFRVIDKKTGEYPDLEKLALEEDWAEGLIYCDMEGFAIMEDGSLVLLDECGNFAYCPFDRFEVVLEASE